MMSHQCVSFMSTQMYCSISWETQAINGMQSIYELFEVIFAQPVPG